MTVIDRTLPKTHYCRIRNKLQLTACPTGQLYRLSFQTTTPLFALQIFEQCGSCLQAVSVFLCGGAYVLFLGACVVRPCNLYVNHRRRLKASDVGRHDFQKFQKYRKKYLKSNNALNISIFILFS